MVLGYCGVILRQTAEYRGYFIPDSADIETHAKSVIEQASLTLTDEDALFGALQALLVEGVRRDNNAIVAVASRAIYEMRQDPFFIVRGFVENHGTLTSYEPLAVSSVDEARETIEAAPEVLTMKALRTVIN